MKPIDFGQDTYHHACGGRFKLYVYPAFAGTQFSHDGYAFDELDVIDGGEDILRCMDCKAEFSFPEWQEYAQSIQKPVAS